MCQKLPYGRAATRPGGLRHHSMYGCGVRRVFSVFVSVGRRHRGKQNGLTVTRQEPFLLGSRPVAQASSRKSQDAVAKSALAQESLESPRDESLASQPVPPVPAHGCLLAAAFPQA